MSVVCSDLNWVSFFFSQSDCQSIVFMVGFDKRVSRGGELRVIVAGRGDRVGAVCTGETPTGVKVCSCSPQARFARGGYTHLRTAVTCGLNRATLT
jgi:hypothetical protein